MKKIDHYMKYFSEFGLNIIRENAVTVLIIDDGYQDPNHYFRLFVFATNNSITHDILIEHQCFIIEPEFSGLLVLESIGEEDKKVLCALYFMKPTTDEYNTLWIDIDEDLGVNLINISYWLSHHKSVVTLSRIFTIAQPENSIEDSKSLRDRHADAKFSTIYFYIQNMIHDQLYSQVIHENGDRLPDTFNYTTCVMNNVLYITTLDQYIMFRAINAAGCDNRTTFCTTIFQINPRDQQMLYTEVKTGRKYFMQVSPNFRGLILFAYYNGGEKQNIRYLAYIISLDNTRIFRKFSNRTYDELVSHIYTFVSFNGSIFTKVLEFFEHPDTSDGLLSYDYNTDDEIQRKIQSIKNHIVEAWIDRM